MDKVGVSTSSRSYREEDVCFSNGEVVLAGTLALPKELAVKIGQIDAVSYPPQGTAFQVVILSSTQGRFILKVAQTPVLIQALVNECRMLRVLERYVPFVAQPLGNAPGDHGHAFLFTYLEGEPLHVVLSHYPAHQRHHLITGYAQALRRIHSWEPALPHPADWLTSTLRWLGQALEKHPLDVRVTGTNSRFDGVDARVLFAHLQAERPALANDLVFCHGDYCLPNVLIQQGAVSGVIDWSLGGYADRRFDLATALFSMRLLQLDAGDLSTFLQTYGYTEPIETLEVFESLHALTCAFWNS